MFYIDEVIYPPLYCIRLLHLWLFISCPQLAWMEGKNSLRTSPWPLAMDEWTIKTPNPICQLFFKLALLTDFAALCLTDFIDWRYISLMVGIFYPVCKLLPPWTKELYWCTVAPLPSLWPPPLPKLNVQYIYRQCVAVGGGGGCWIVL